MEHHVCHRAFLTKHISQSIKKGRGAGPTNWEKMLLITAVSCLPVLYKADLLQVRWVRYLFANLLSNCGYPLQVATKGPFQPYVSSASSTLPWTHHMTLLNIILQDQNSGLCTSKGIKEQNTGYLLEAWKLALRFYGYPHLAQYFHNCSRLTYCVEPTHLALKKKKKTIRVHHAPMQSKLWTKY